MEGSEITDLLLVLALFLVAALSIYLVWLKRRHRRCKATLVRVAGERDFYRTEAMHAEARLRGVGGVGAAPSVGRISA